MSRAALAVLAFLFVTDVAQGQTTPPQQTQRIRGDIAVSMVSTSG